MNLTREQAIAEHRKMWNWIANQIERVKQIESIGRLKIKYIKQIRNVEHYVSCECFCCEYAKQNREIFYHVCHKCPIEWDSDVEEFMCTDKKTKNDDMGLFARCCNAKTWQEQAALARQIANLPERTDV